MLIDTLLYIQYTLDFGSPKYNPKVYPTSICILDKKIAEDIFFVLVKIIKFAVETELINNKQNTTKL